MIENGASSIPVTLGELMEEWMSKKRDVKKQTIAGYHSHYENHIKNKKFAKLKIKEIKLQDCKDIIADVVNFREKKDGCEVGLGYNTVRHIKSEISMALDYAVANDYIRANYMPTVKINQGLCDSREPGSLKRGVMRSCSSYAKRQLMSGMLIKNIVTALYC